MKILLVADVPNWAFDYDASAVIKYLPQYDISKTYATNFSEDMFQTYDHIHFMNWFDGKPYSSNVSASVSSHNFELLHGNEYKAYFPKYKALIATSKLIYDKIKNLNKKVFYAAGGVHEDLFVPVKKPLNKKIVVGWVGQKTSGGLTPGQKIDIKGYYIVLLPLVKEMQQYNDIEFKILDRDYRNAIPYSEMPKFYQDIDCQICTSLAEGAPNPMFEAAACGKALISTRVGTISECIEHNVNGFLIDAYTTENEVIDRIRQFKKYILFLKDNRDICEKMGEKSREIIEKNWRWRDRAKQWIPLFEYAKTIKEII